MHSCKSIKVSLLFLCLLFLGADTLIAIPIQTWIDTYFLHKVSDDIQIELNQEFEFLDAYQKLYYYYFEPLAYIKLSKHFKVGFQSRIYAIDFLGIDCINWDGAIEPGIMLKQEFKLFGFECFTREKALYRIFFKHFNQRYLRFQAGVKVAEKGPASFFVINEAYFNYFNTSTIDLDYIQAYVSFNLPKGFVFDLFASYFVYKEARRTSYLDGLVFGFALTYGAPQQQVGFR